METRKFKGEKLEWQRTTEDSSDFLSALSHQPQLATGLFTILYVPRVIVKSGFPFADFSSVPCAILLSTAVISRISFCSI